MPQLRLYGRPWYFGSDDLPFVMSFGAVFHAVWVVILIVGAVVKGPSKCDVTVALNVVLYGLICSFLLSVVLDVILTLEGLKGGIFETHKRAKTEKLMYVQALNVLVKIGLNAYGTHVVFTWMPACLEESHKLKRAMTGVIISTWVVIGLLLLFTFLLYKVGSTDTVSGWHKRIRLLNFCLCGGVSSTNDDTDTLAQVSFLFAHFFRPIDFTPSDTLAAMMLTAHRQKFDRQAALRNSRERQRPGKDTWRSIRSSTMDQLDDRDDGEDGWHIQDAVRSVGAGVDQHRPLGRPCTSSRSSELAVVSEEGELDVSERKHVGQLPLQSPHTDPEDVRDCEQGLGREEEEEEGDAERGEGGKILEKKIEIVVDGMNENRLNNQEPIGEGSVGGGLGPSFVSPTRRRRDRNLAFDFSSVNFMVGGGEGEGEGEGEGATIEFSECDQTGSIASTEKNDQLSPGSRSRSQASPVREQVWVENDAGEQPSRVFVNGEAENEESEVSSVASDSCSAQTMLTWGGDSVTGPFLTPPGGEDFMTADSGEVPLESLERMLKYHRYAIAAYGALFYISSGKGLMSAPVRCCSLCIDASPPNTLRRNYRTLLSGKRTDRALLKNASLKKRLDNQAILKWGVKEDDVIWRNYTNCLNGKLPYFVALDREDLAVVVAVRGTLSWADLVTDFFIYPEPLSEEELQEVEGLLEGIRGPSAGNFGEREGRVSVHKGMLKAARALVKDLEDSELLAMIESRAVDPDKGLKADIFGWKLVFTGHSLGAGVCSLATLLLRKRFPDIHCYAVSPPGGVMSTELANAIAPFCTSLMHAKDMIPRLSLQTMEKLRDRMVQSVAQCKFSKAQILVGGLLRKKYRESELFMEQNDVGDQSMDALQAYKSTVEHLANRDGLCLARNFVAPGRIIFLRPIKRGVAPGSCGKYERTFNAVWTSGQEVAREGVLMSSHMFTDHFPFNSIDSLASTITARQVELAEAV